ncbi:MAG: peptidylprolyl isomerase, partial [Neisseria sp.]|nr:peptidylprolyl isomerase [Neisseria sp.]
MLHKRMIVAATLACTSFAVAAPKLDPQRVNIAIAQMEAQYGKQLPSAARAEVEKQLQSMEILKAEAFKAGLNQQKNIQAKWQQFIDQQIFANVKQPLTPELKAQLAADPQFQAILQNAEAFFYANQYSEHLAKSVKLDEAKLRADYQKELRVIKVQQVNFATAEEVKAAQQLLLKGLSFEDLMKRYPNPDQQVRDFITIKHLKPELAKIIEPMKRGQVTHEPVAYNGKFYLFKLNADERVSQAPSFEQARVQIVEQIQQQEVQKKIAEILKQHG